MMRLPEHLTKLPDWPAGMTRDVALAYTGVGEVQLREWQKTGRVRFTPRGPKGSMLALRTELDAALAELFTDVTEDMDFG